MSATTPCVLAVVREVSQFAVLESELAKLGVRTCHARTPQDAVPKEHFPANVIVCDVDTIDWGEALALFRERQPGSPVVFLTRLADEQLWIQMLDAGVYDLLEKPYRAEDLRWVVTSALKRTRPLTCSAVA